MWRRPRTYMFAGLVLMVLLAGWLLQSTATEQVDSYAACASAGYTIMDTDPPTCSDGTRTFLGPKSSPTPSAPAVSTAAFEILVEGDSGGNYAQRQEVITSSSDWLKYWSTVHSGLPSVPPILPVDFGHDNVVALSEGRRPTGGFNLKVTGIQISATGTSVSVSESIPGPTCTVPKTPSNRYYIARTDKLPTPVSFRFTKEMRHC